jgi:hypothetical protein
VSPLRLFLLCPCWLSVCLSVHLAVNALRCLVPDPPHHLLSPFLRVSQPSAFVLSLLSGKLLSQHTAYIGWTSEINTSATHRTIKATVRNTGRWVFTLMNTTC